MQSIAKEFDSLPQDLQLKVIDYINELKQKKKTKKKRLSMNWAGGLKEYKDQFTSLELQKQSP